MSVPKCLFFQDLEGLTKVFGRMSAGISGQKLPLWAEFSFLISKTGNCLTEAESVGMGGLFSSSNTILDLPEQTAEKILFLQKMRL